jgi:inosine-uridine nucleoside N-ribohydrolase
MLWSGTAECGPREAGRGVDVVLRLIERAAARPIDVACGRDTPIAGDHPFPDAGRAGAGDGSGLRLPATSRQPFAGTAVELIARTADDVDGLRVLTLGPLTNLAEALKSHPDLAQRLESVYALGGALFVPGNLGFGGPPDMTIRTTMTRLKPTGTVALAAAVAAADPPA